MIFNKLKENTKALTRGGLTQKLLAGKKKRGILQSLAKMNMMKGLGAMGKGLSFRKR